MKTPVDGSPQLSRSVSERHRLACLQGALVLVLVSAPAPVFAEDDGPFGGLVRSQAYVFEFDDNNVPTGRRHGNGAAVSLRGMYDDLFANLRITVAAQYGVLSGDNIMQAVEAERSSRLSWRYSGETDSALDVDRLAIQFATSNWEAMFGRMPVNLSRTFYFTPNDFFAPFAAQAFFREYKPGVDALRLAWEPQPLWRLSVISIEGYARDMSTDTGWSVEPDAERRSWVGVASAPVAGTELGVLGGHVRDRKVIGGSVQTSLFSLLDIRAEGHRAELDQAPHGSYARWAAGLGYRPSAELDLRYEYYYQGDGAHEVKRYRMNPLDSMYLARRYASAGLVWQASPLTTLNSVWLRNGIDHSSMIIFGLVHSLADDSDIDLTFSVPRGKPVKNYRIESEYGAYPVSVVLEWRAHF
ncbi:MAG: hypothetical protein OEZ10_07825 [Gammaproteobacteria bacterium]|nr:hypothetical protein [Gammaproteobacteria bacterium]